MSNGRSTGYGKPPVGPVKININLNDLEDVVCPNCDNSIFSLSFVRMKKLGVVQSPNNKPMILKVEVAVCSKCESVFQVAEDKLIPIT